MNYRPTAFDIRWTQSLIDKMKDGGIWGIPRCQTVWRFDKTNKILICIHGDYEAPDSLALRTICPLIGWKTMLKIEAMTQAEIDAAMTNVTADMAGTGKTVSRITVPTDIV